MMAILSFNMLFYILSFVQCCNSLRCTECTYSWLVWRAEEASVFRKTTILVQTHKIKFTNKGRTQFYPLFLIQHRTAANAANAANAAITKSPPMVPPMVALSWFEFGLGEVSFGGSLKKKKKNPLQFQDRDSKVTTVCFSCHMPACPEQHRTGGTCVCNHCL